MKSSALKYAVLSTTLTICLAIIAFVPFHAFLTIWLSTAVGHYTALRLWKEVLLIIAALGAVYLFIFDGKVRSGTQSRKLIWVILSYILLTLISGLVAYYHHNVTAKAFGYGLIANTRFLIFFLVTWTVALRTDRLKMGWWKIVVIPALIVSVFGFLQVTVLPNDFLKHFGYGPQTIAPYQTINSNRDYVRIESTLRGVNPLGAYMAMLATFFVVYIKFLSKKKFAIKMIALGIAGLVTLTFSFSRSAWIGAVVSVLIAGVVAIRNRTRMIRSLIIIGIGSVLLLVIGIALQNNTKFQNLVLHTDRTSKIRSTSDGGHKTAIKNGVHDIASQPLGRGVGTAGPASVHNNAKVRLAENYFIQIGQEVGIFGLGLFLLIIGGVGYLLWVRRSDPLALSLFASLIGLSVVNLLSHAWADDTLAYVWWGLAGIAMAQPASKQAAVTSEKA